MNVASAALLVAILGVAVVHTKSRIAAAFAACMWCIGAMVYGAYNFQTTEGLNFLGIWAPPWVYFTSLSGLFVFNGAVIARALRRRRRAADKGPTPAGS